MKINYYSKLLTDFIKQNQPFSLSDISNIDLKEFIEHRTDLAETEFETQRKSGFDIVSAQESAIYVLFDGIITEQESYFKSIIEENFPNIFESLIIENQLNVLIQKVLPIYQNLLENSNIDENKIKYELIAEIENLIQHNGI